MQALQSFQNLFISFCPQKVEKPTLKSCSEKLKSTFFPLLPAQPKWPKPIDQLYIELGCALTSAVD